MEGLTRAFVDLNLWSVFVTLCNTFITFLVVRHFLFGPLRRLLADREREVRGLYARAETERREAAAMKRDYTVSMENARREAGEIVADARRQAEAAAQQIVGQARREAAAARQRAEAGIARDRRRAMEQLKGEVAGLSAQIASRMVAREVRPEDHRRLIEQFIDRVGERHGVGCQ